VTVVTATTARWVVSPSHHSPSTRSEGMGLQEAHSECGCAMCWVVVVTTCLGHYFEEAKKTGVCGMCVFVGD
jgi:hypothetical protein